MQHVAGNFGVGGDVAQHGGHIWTNHARTLADTGHGDGYAFMLELTAGTLWQGVGGHDAGCSLGPVVLGQIVQRGLQCAFDLLDRQRLADHPGGIRQHCTGINAGQFSQPGAGPGCSDQPWLTGTGVGIARVGQQIANRALHTLFGQNHRGRAKRIQGENTRHAGAFGAAHNHHVLAPCALDTGRSDTQFKTGHRVQNRQRTKTNSHDALLKSSVRRRKRTGIQW